MKRRRRPTAAISRRLSFSTRTPDYGTSSPSGAAAPRAVLLVSPTRRSARGLARRLPDMIVCSAPDAARQPALAVHLARRSGQSRSVEPGRRRARYLEVLLWSSPVSGVPLAEALAARDSMDELRSAIEREVRTPTHDHRRQ